MDLILDINSWLYPMELGQYPIRSLARFWMKRLALAAARKPPQCGLGIELGRLRPSTVRYVIHTHIHSGAFISLISTRVSPPSTCGLRVCLFNFPDYVANALGRCQGRTAWQHADRVAVLFDHEIGGEGVKTATLPPTGRRRRHQRHRCRDGHLISIFFISFQSMTLGVTI